MKTNEEGRNEHCGSERWKTLVEETEWKELKVIFGLYLQRSKIKPWIESFHYSSQAFSKGLLFLRWYWTWHRERFEWLACDNWRLIFDLYTEDQRSTDERMTPYMNAALRGESIPKKQQTEEIWEGTVGGDYCSHTIPDWERWDSTYYSWVESHWYTCIRVETEVEKKEDWKEEGRMKPGRKQLRK